MNWSGAPIASCSIAALAGSKLPCHDADLSTSCLAGSRPNIVPSYEIHVICGQAFDGFNDNGKAVTAVEVKGGALRIPGTAHIGQRGDEVIETVDAVHVQLNCIAVTWQIGVCNADTIITGASIGCGKT